MNLNSTKKTLSLIVSTIVVFSVGCNQRSQEIDLANNESHKHQAFTQILNDPQLQKEFMGQLMVNEEAKKRMMRDRDFTGELFSSENMNYMWDNNPGMDTTVIDNVTTRMHADTAFMKNFDSRMERGTPSNTP